MVSQIRQLGSMTEDCATQRVKPLEIQHPTREFPLTGVARDATRLRCDYMRACVHEQGPKHPIHRENGQRQMSYQVMGFDDFMSVYKNFSISRSESYGASRLTLSTPLPLVDCETVYNPRY